MRNKRLMTLIEAALLETGISTAYITSMVEAKRKVDIQPVFINGYRQYAIFIANQPNHILALFRSRKVARWFIKHFELEVNYDGVFE